MTERTGYIKVTGLYRWFEGAHFNHAYYSHEHAGLTVRLLKPLGLLRFECDETLAEAFKPGDVVAASQAYFSDLNEAKAALAKAGAALADDVPKYTNIRPALHLSRVRSQTV